MLHIDLTNDGVFDGDMHSGAAGLERRPHEQRTLGPRKARRLNHPFQHLYRHDDPSHFPTYENSTYLSSMGGEEYLLKYGGYETDVVKDMNRTFPPLLDLDVRRHLHPKMRFLKYTIGGVGEVNNLNASQSNGVSCTDQRQMIRLLSNLGRNVPPQYYGARLERTVAPRHAFLMHMKLPHGPILLKDRGKLLREFLVSSRRTKQFCALCNTWRRTYGYYTSDEPGKEKLDGGESSPAGSVTPRQVEAFDALFQRGMMAAARDDMDNSNVTQHSRHVNVTSAQMIRLLIKHGGNPVEKDVRGVSLMHWAAGAGNLDGLKELVDALPGGIEEAVHMKAGRDGATPLHWAAAGAKPKEFGCGGHTDMCKFILENCAGDEKNAVNTLTKDGNSVLMWAAWSATLDAVKLLIRHRADPTAQNRNGCTVAHWAASGGNLEVCKYLSETVGVDFKIENYAGNTPLSHAVAYGRADVVRWLREEVCAKDEDGRAEELAGEFVGWIGDEKRKKVFDLFQEWHAEIEGSPAEEELSRDRVY